MKILLLKSVPHLGLPGDERVVKDGYARNFLLPQGLAILAHDPRAVEIRQTLAIEREVASRAAEQANKAAASWDGRHIKLHAKANPDGTLFAAVTRAQVAQELGLTQKHVRFSPTKSLGMYEAQIEIGHDATATVTVEIQAA